MNRYDMSGFHRNEAFPKWRYTLAALYTPQVRLSEIYDTYQWCYQEMIREMDRMYEQNIELHSAMIIPVNMPLSAPMATGELTP